MFVKVQLPKFMTKAKINLFIHIKKIVSCKRIVFLKHK